MINVQNTGYSASSATVHRIQVGHTKLAQPDVNTSLTTPVSPLNPIHLSALPPPCRPEAPDAQTEGSHTPMVSVNNAMMDITWNRGISRAMRGRSVPVGGGAGNVEAPEASPPADWSICIISGGNMDPMSVPNGEEESVSVGRVAFGNSGVGGSSVGSTEMFPLMGGTGAPFICRMISSNAFIGSPASLGCCSAARAAIVRSTSAWYAAAGSFGGAGVGVREGIGSTTMSANAVSEWEPDSLSYKTDASSPRAVVASFARPALPRARIFARRASALRWASDWDMA